MKTKVTTASFLFLSLFILSGSALPGGASLARADDPPQVDSEMHDVPSAEASSVVSPEVSGDPTDAAYREVDEQGSGVSTEATTPTEKNEASSEKSELAADSGELTVIDNGEDDVAGKLNATYFGIFYGPSVSKPTSYQATPNGIPESDKPVMLKNFLGLGYNFTDHVRLTPTAYWQWMPTSGGAYSVQDPFLKLSDDSIFSTDEWNLYGDVRYHAPTSAYSHAIDLNGSVQSVQVITFLPEGTRYMFGLYGSEREYFYGPKGQGNDLELYLGPNINYQLTPDLQLTMLYELNAVHVYGAQTRELQGDGNDFQPGLSWDITPRMNLHPYLNFFPTSLSLSNVSVGMLVYWQAF